MNQDKKPLSAYYNATVHEDYLEIVNVKGVEFSADESTKKWLEHFAQARKHGLTRILVDGVAPSSDIRLSDMFHATEEFFKRGFVGFRTALVFETIALDKASREFLQLASENRSNAVGFFRSRDEALTWLLGIDS